MTTMFSLKLTYKGENKVTYWRESKICANRNDIIAKAQELGGFPVSYFEISFQSEEDLYKLNQFIAALL